MSISWTSEQSEAVFAKVSNLLITAAAGSGKTQVLSGRIIREITEGVTDINRLLIVTFTNAAAAEMRERIGKSLAEELKKNPNNKHLRRQLSLIGTADITTMHSFCLNVVKNNFFVAGLEPGFKIADDAEAKLLKSEAALIALDELYAEENSYFLQFADSFSQARDDLNITEMAKDLMSFAESMPFPLEWIKNQTEKYNIESKEEFKNSDIAKSILKSAIYKIKTAIGLAEKASSLCTYVNGLDPLKETFQADKNALESVLGFTNDWDSLYYVLNELSFVRRKNAKNADEKALEKVLGIRDDLKNLAKEAISILGGTALENAKIIKNTYPLVKGLAILAERYEKIYAELKKERGLLDFSDIEHLCIHLLAVRTETGEIVPSAVANDIMDKYDEIYIDEYQDSNAAQELIFSLVSREREENPNIFMVGDMKQSIYGFRQTSPELFLNKKLHYKMGEDEKYRKIQLSKNFRSRAEVLDYINHVFYLLMKEDTGGIDYNDEEKLFPGAAYPPAPDIFKKTEINVINMQKETEDDEDLEKEEAEARLIAQKINELISSKQMVYDLKKGEERPIKYSDIVILMRSIKTSAPIMEAELLNAGIPVYSDSGLGYFETIEIKTFLALLSIIDNPRVDIELIATLRSPMFSFNEEELARIRLCDKNSDFYSALVSAAEGSDELSEKCKDFLRKLANYRSRKTYMPTDELIWYLLKDTGYMEYVTALPSGELKRANLRLLFEKASQYEKTSFRGLFNFINYLDKMQSTGDMGGAKLIGENHDVVRIMSIHKSKGLEFPVVILANTGKKFNKASETGKMLLHKDMGIGLNYIDNNLRITYETPVKRAAKIKIHEESMAEELRVLYVALTRAKEKLIITGTVNDITKEATKWEMGASLLNPDIIFSAKNLLEWLCICAVLSNCEGLHSLLEIEGEGQGVSVDFNIHSRSSLCKSDNALEESTITANEVNVSDDTKSCLAYIYPNYHLQGLPSKVTVTELKRLMASTDEDAIPLYKSVSLKKPRFLEGEGKISSAGKGSIWHFVMQTIDFKNTNSLEDIRAHLKSLEERKILSCQQIDVVEPEKILAFINSPIGQRVKKADKVFKETPFTMPAPASLITGKAEHASETVIVQGIIDLFFFEGDNLVLVDYKTDRSDDTLKIKNQYEMQMNFYALALSQKYFLKIHEKFIYLFYNNDIIVYN